MNSNHTEFEYVVLSHHTSQTYLLNHGKTTDKIHTQNTKISRNEI